MTRRKIALVGNSGAGKSSVLLGLGRSLEAADMDVHFDTKVCPPYKEVLTWMLDRTGGEDIIAVSTHMTMLEEMRDAKRENRDRNLLDQILFIYLYNPYPARHKEFLEMPNAWQAKREKWHIDAVLVNHERIYLACRDLADVTINTPDLGLERVVTLVAALQDAVLGHPSKHRDGQGAVREGRVSVRQD